MQDATRQGKDCGNIHIVGTRPRIPIPASARKGTLSRSMQAKRFVAALALTVALCAVPVRAGSVRLWPSGVVVEDTVRVADLCEIRGFEYETERTLAHAVVAEAPPPGGSVVIDMEALRGALTAAGANMATVTLHGATACTVRRPSTAVTGRVAAPDSGESAGKVAEAYESHGGLNNDPLAGSALQVNGSVSAEHQGRTMREAIISHFDAILGRYGGKADVVFNKAAGQALDLAGPAYEFRIRRKEGPPLGLLQMDVGIVSDGRLIQTVPIVAQVSMVRPSVVARRAINQGATIESQDVERVAMTFTRLDKLGLVDTSRVVGQRAKRFIPAGTLIDASMFESVPLVTRGQLVTVHSVAGSVQVVTTATAVEDGLLGETVTVRALDRKRLEFEARVVGPGTVQLGGKTVDRQVALHAGEGG